MRLGGKANLSGGAKAPKLLPRASGHLLSGSFVPEQQHPMTQIAHEKVEMLVGRIISPNKNV